MKLPVARFKVGDKVKVVSSIYTNIPSGTLGTIVENTSKTVIEETGKNYGIYNTKDYVYLVSLELDMICSLTFKDAQLRLV